MTIKLKSWGYASNGTQLTGEIEYDYPKDSGAMFTESIIASVSQIINMTEQQIESWIITRITEKRAEHEKTLVDNLLNPIKDKELES